MSDFPGGQIFLNKRLDGAVRIKFNRETIVVTPHYAIMIAKALLKLAGVDVYMREGKVISRD